MTSVAISETITTIAEAEKRFNLYRSPSNNFFTEWTSFLPKISDRDQTDIDTLWNRYIYHRSGGHLLENTVMLLLVSPLLTIAGFYDPPFRIKAEESVRITVSDSEETLQGRIDLLILSLFFSRFSLRALASTPPMDDDHHESRWDTKPHRHLLQI